MSLFKDSIVLANDLYLGNSSLNNSVWEIFELSGIMDMAYCVAQEAHICSVLLGR